MKTSYPLSRTRAIGHNTFRACILCASILALACFQTPKARAAAELDTNRIAAIARMLPQQPQGVGRPAADRDAWTELGKSAQFAAQVEEAEALAAKPDPALPDDLYLDFSRTGNRDHAQRVMFERAKRLETFTVAECVENKGRFIEPVTKTITALCDEKTWVYPAHDGKLDNFHGRSISLDLRSTAVAWELATADYMLGDKLSKETRQLIRDNVHRRVLDPFRDMVQGRRAENGWLRIENNWNAVCLSGVVGAELALEESPQDRALFAAAAEFYIRYFLKSFPPDGYCTEGLGYWNYGFGHFVLLTETLRQATGGKIDLISNPAAANAALFPTRDEILKGVYTTIADCSPGTSPSPDIVRYIQERLGISKDGRGDQFKNPKGALPATGIYAFLPNKLPLAQQFNGIGDSPLRSWFPDGGLLITRNAAIGGATFAAALKGGSNGEQHNHNDVGSFSVVVGKRMILCDPGGEVYTARTFSAHRYESMVINSFGHAVPIIAGKLQRTGSAARAAVLRSDFTDDTDTLSMDIRSAYPVPDLKKLERTFVFKRDKPALTVSDEVEFASPQTFESAMITWGTMTQAADDVLLIQDGDTTVRVKIDTGGQRFTVKEERINEDVHTPVKPLHIGIVLESPVEKAKVALTITPE